MQVLAHNLASQFTNRQLNITTDKKAKSSEKLSSGYKINRSADDAAGLQISEKMRWQIRGLDQASENIQDGISLCQVADGALNESHAVLQRMRELSVQAANDTNSDEDRETIQQEIDQLTKEVDRIANDTSFNEDIYPLKGSGNGGTTQGTGNITKELTDIDYQGKNTQIIDSRTISSFSSYTASDGKIHYKLPSGTYQISNLNNIVLDLTGDVCIENTNLTNVSLECESGTNLSIKNVVIDNSQNVSKNIYVSNTEIGAAIKFNGTNNTLNCFGSNKIFGGADDYTSYTSLYGDKYRKACAGIEVGNNVELTINGTANSILNVEGNTTDSESGRKSWTDTSSAAIGSCNGDYTGKIIFNSGNLAINKGTGVIGDTIVINGGKMDIKSDVIAIGSLKSGKIEINGGTINATSNSPVGNPTIGHLKGGIIDINGGNINVLNNLAAGVGGAAIGGTEAVGVINIKGGNIIAETTSQFSAAIGSSVTAQGGIINIEGGIVKAIASNKVDAVGDGQANRSESQSYVDGILTSTIGDDDGNGHHIYNYIGKSNSGGNNGIQGNNNTLWIQMGAQKDQGMFLKLVNATAKGVGITDPALDVTDFNSASTSIARLDDAISKVSSYRSSFGAQQNRLEYGKQVDDNTAENTQKAESLIRDTDMSEEMVNYSKNNILEQAGQALLAQANQSMQGILQLLQ